MRRPWSCSIERAGAVEAWRERVGAVVLRAVGPYLAERLLARLAAAFGYSLHVDEERGR